MFISSTSSSSRLLYSFSSQISLSPMASKSTFSRCDGFQRRFPYGASQAGATVNRSIHAVDAVDANARNADLDITWGGGEARAEGLGREMFFGSQDQMDLKPRSLDPTHFRFGWLVYVIFFPRIL